MVVLRTSKVLKGRHYKAPPPAAIGSCKASSLVADAPKLTRCLRVVLCQDPQLESGVMLQAFYFSTDLLLLYDQWVQQIRSTAPAWQQRPSDMDQPPPYCECHAGSEPVGLTSEAVRKPATSITVVKSFGSKSGRFTPSGRAPAPARTGLAQERQPCRRGAEALTQSCT